MPTIRIRTFKWSTGLVSKATLDGTSTIQSWDVQTDMHPSVVWNEPEWEQSTVAERDAEAMLSGRVIRNGFLTGQIVFGFLTHDMLEYIIAQKFPSSVESCDQTFLYTNDENEAQYIQCHMVRPRQKTQTMNPAFGGWSNVIFKYTNGVDIT